jgi:hypothetical protein
MMTKKLSIKDLFVKKKYNIGTKTFLKNNYKDQNCMLAKNPCCEHVSRVVTWADIRLYKWQKKSYKGLILRQKIVEGPFKYKMKITEM